MDSILVTQSHTLRHPLVVQSQQRALLCRLFSHHVNLSRRRHVRIPHAVQDAWCSNRASTLYYHRLCTSPKLATRIQIAVTEPPSNKKRPHQAQLFHPPLTEVNTICLAHHPIQVTITPPPLTIWLPTGTPTLRQPLSMLFFSSNPP